MSKEAVAEEPNTEATETTEATQAAPATEAQTELTGHQQFLEMLPEDMRSDPMFRNFDGENANEALGKMAKSYVNAQKLIGADPNAVLKIPANEEDAAWNDIYSKLGRPETPEEYDLDSIKEVEGISEDNLKEIAEVAHKNGVSNKALAAIAEVYKGQIEGLSGKSDEEMDSIYKEYDQDLEKHFGSAFEARTSKIQEELKAKADPEFIQLAKDYPWIMDHPSVIKTFDNFIKASSESSGPKEGKGSGDHAMTPNEALAEINAMDGDKEIVKIMSNSSDPRQKELVAKRSKLFAMAYPTG